MFVSARGHGGSVLRRFLDVRPVQTVFLNGFSQEADLFKFYSEAGASGEHRPLAEEDYGRFVSARAARREPALTRQITTLAYRVGKEMISLAEGMPNEGVFPFSRLELDCHNGDKLVLGEELNTALQYLPSQGLPALLSELRDFQQSLHRPPPLARDIIVTNGAQHGIYQCFDLLVDPGDPVLMTEYSYTGAHAALKPLHPEILTIPEDDFGLIPEFLERILDERLTRGKKMPRVLYLVPTGNNPTGTVLPEDRRREIYDLACRYDFLILEDDPYMFLNYDDEAVPSFLSLDSAGRVLRLDSLSKVVSSGLRGGWLTAPRPLLQRVELHMQAELLHSCTLSQTLVHRIVSNRTALAAHLRGARALYRRRRDSLLRALRPLRALAHYSAPRAGLFLWLRVSGVPDVYNMVFETAFKRGLMLIPGQAFQQHSAAPSQHLRLTFSKIPMEHMEVAAHHLAEIIKEEQQRSLQKPQRVGLATQQ